MTSALIDTANLENDLQQGSARLIDATYGMPGHPATAQAAMQKVRIGDAQFFDIDAVADKQSQYPHMVPSAEDFAKAVGAMGIGQNDAVVIYDQTGISFAAARVWWMFRLFGHTNVRVLNGGLPAWRVAGLPLNSGPVVAPEAKPYVAAFNPALYRSFEQMEDGGDTVLDARAAARFEATVHSMDGDAVPAHIAGSYNVPFMDLLDYTGTLKNLDLVKSYVERPNLVASCGSGVTACVLALALHELGRADVAIYDGSWTEWSDRQGLR